MYYIKYTNKFKKDVKRCQKRGRDLNLLRDAVDMLAQTGTLPPKYKTHSLTGKYKNRLECHIQPDWLLVWMQNDTDLVLLFTDTGTHSDLF
jgi:mRNA interferase YafQ